MMSLVSPEHLQGVWPLMVIQAPKWPFLYFLMLGFLIGGTVKALGFWRLCSYQQALHFCISFGHILQAVIPPQPLLGTLQGYLLLLLLLLFSGDFKLLFTLSISPTRGDSNWKRMQTGDKMLHMSQTGLGFHSGMKLKKKLTKIRKKYPRKYRKCRKKCSQINCLC